MSENINENEDIRLEKNDDSFFCVPSEPVSQISISTLSKPAPQPPPLKAKSSQSAEKNLPKLNYEKPEWSSQPPIATGESELDEEGYCKHYYLEVNCKK